MQTINLNSSQSGKRAEYPIQIGDSLLSSLSSIFKFDGYTKIAIVTDETVSRLPWFKSFYDAFSIQFMGQCSLVVLPDGEEAKTFDVAGRVWKQFQETSLDRKSLSISVGGGSICDLNGFASSTYMRGIDFIHVPTTLLAQVDASIGGKVAINFNNVKNLIGVFADPRAVIIDTETLQTLPARELASGYAEVIKHGLIKDKQFYERLKTSYAVRTDPSNLKKIIYESCKIKAAVVAEDHDEQGLRKILNFGHTIGHALESLSLQQPKPLLHGEAISIGMVAEAKLSEYLGFLTHKDVLDIEETLRLYELPTRATFVLDYEDVAAKIRSDKKVSGALTNWSLLEKIGKAVFNQQASAEQIKETLSYVSNV